MDHWTDSLEDSELHARLIQHGINPHTAQRLVHDRDQWAASDEIERILDPEAYKV
jgi:hypothetical protein